MSKDSQKITSSQNMPQEATQQKKLTKVGARYSEIDEFKDSDHHNGFGGMRTKFDSFLLLFMLSLKFKKIRAYEPMI